MTAGSLGAYAGKDACPGRGEAAEVALTARNVTIGALTCELVGGWTTLHAPTATLSVRLGGCSGPRGLTRGGTLRTTPLSTGKTLFSIDRPKRIVAVRFCRHLPPLPRARPKRR